MTFKKYENLTDTEVARAEMMSLRIMLAVLLNQAFASHPNPSAAYKEMEIAVAQIVAQIPLKAIEKSRQQAYRDLVVERASGLLNQAKGLRRENVGKPN